MAQRKRSEGTASEQQNAAVLDVRARAWELHLRGWSKLRIASELGISRDTVGRYIAACYAEAEGDARRAKLRRKLAAAIVRMRRVQEQAWADHDADDERERSVLDAAKPGSRYQSQRSQYLRVILDAEREIARLEGLYESVGDVESAVVFRIERVGAQRFTAEDAEQSEGAAVSAGEDSDDGE